MLLHLAAAAVCFAFLVFAPIITCLIFMAVDNDPGGPMFFPIFVVGVIAFAFVITCVLAFAALSSDLLRRRYRVPIWLPPIVVLLVASAFCWLFLRNAHPVVPLIGGGIVALAFTVHWAAISTVWFLPRLLFRLFGVQANGRD
jgi:hypothetical protein